MKVIIGGTARDAAHYAAEHGWKRSEWIHPQVMSDLLGRNVTEVIYAGLHGSGPEMARIADTAEMMLARNLTTTRQVEENSHMTTSTQQTPLYLVNVDPADSGTGYAIIGLVMAQANKPTRTHLHGSVLSFQYDQERGIGILVRDAGARQHLANSLALDPEVKDFRVSSPAPGTGYRRSGEIEGIKVTIWNFEA